MELTSHPFLRQYHREVIADALELGCVRRTGNGDDRLVGQHALALGCLELVAVRGVPDAIGHADGFTTYTVEVEARLDVDAGRKQFSLRGRAIISLP